MAAFLSGMKTVTVDVRGRMSFPAQYLGVLGNSLCLTPNTDGSSYITVNSEEGFQKTLEEFQEKYTGSKLRMIMRHWCSATVTVEPDKMGRITLPKELCDHAKINGKATVVGVGKYAEIWDEDTFREQEEADMEEINSLMAEED